MLVRQLPAPGDRHLLRRLPALGAALLDLLDHGVTRNHVPEDHVLAVQPVRLGGGDEELAAVGAGSAVGH